ncbi:MAG: helix-turn-helix transcriptional regulator [Thermoleophilia bacterium]|nr:helix-turn-helix transcriptional regulator [Thermoleophilia bacterium]
MPVLDERKVAFGREMRRLRMAALMTQEEWADHVGSCVGTIRQWERGNTVPHKITLRRLVMDHGLDRELAAEAAAVANQGKVA